MINNNLDNSPLGALPYANGAKLITNFLAFFSTTLPRLPQMVDQGLASRALYETLVKMDDRALARIGITRTGIPAYVAAEMGYVPRREPELEPELELEAVNHGHELAA